MNQDNLQKAKHAAAKKLLGPNYPNNVVAVGIGNKITRGNDTGTLCVRVYVLQKFTPDKLSASALVPPEFLDVPTDVIPVGRFGRNGRIAGPPPQPATIGPGSPIRVQANVPNVNSGAFGTLGAVLSDGSGKNYILGCNHVLAVNGRVPERSAILSNEVKIGTYNGNEFFVGLKRGGSNSVDCALGLLDGHTISFAFPNECHAVSPGPIPPQRGMSVAKAGSISGITQGTIVDVDVEGYIDYSFGTFHFVNQVMIDGGKGKVFAVAGDSGSVVWGQDGAKGTATAMIFAAAVQFAMATPLATVLKALEDQTKTRSLTIKIGT